MIYFVGHTRVVASRDYVIAKPISKVLKDPEKIKAAEAEALLEFDTGIKEEPLLLAAKVESLSIINLAGSIYPNGGQLNSVNRVRDIGVEFVERPGASFSVDGHPDSPLVLFVGFDVRDCFRLLAAEAIIAGKPLPYEMWANNALFFDPYRHFLTTETERKQQPFELFLKFFGAPTVPIVSEDIATYRARTAKHVYEKMFPA